jgi:hypothetical protein
MCDVGRLEVPREFLAYSQIVNEGQPSVGGHYSAVSDAKAVIDTPFALLTGHTQRSELVSIRDVFVHRDEIQKTATATLFGLFEFPFTRAHGNQYKLRRQIIVNSRGNAGESRTIETMGTMLSMLCVPRPYNSEEARDHETKISRFGANSRKLNLTPTGFGNKFVLLGVQIAKHPVCNDKALSPSSSVYLELFVGSNFEISAP